MRVGFAIILTVVIASSILLNSYTILPLAFGHGLGKQETQPQDVDDRIAFMNVKIAPELIEYGKLKDIVLTMELVDAQTEEKIPGTAYHLIIEKFADDTLLLDEAFHIMSDSDTLVINFKTTDEGDVVVNGMKMGETLGYMASEDELVVGGPIFNQLGLYSFTIEVVAMEGETLDKDKRATYEALITLAESKTYSVTYDGEEYNLETISYFDNIVDFKFDPDSKSIKMTMPFRWQKDFVEQIPLLHAEIFIPKAFSELAGQELGGLINGIEDPIFVDRSPPGEVVVHYMTPKNRLLNLSEMITNDGMQDDIVEFGLVSLGAVEEEDGKPLPMPVSTGDWSPVMQTSTSGESILVEVQWSPLTIKADEDVTFKLKFIDPESNEEIDNVRFDIMLYDPDENHVDASHRSKQTTYPNLYI